jgi:nucleotide-binding universal stress UspA family protein
MKPVQIKKILVPVDFSSTSLIAFEHAVNLAKTFNASLFLLHVIEKNLFMHDIFLPETRMINVDNIANIAEEKLNELAQSALHDASIVATVIVKQGKVSREIIKVADDTGADVIVMGTHGASGIEEFFIGSNAERVVVNAHCPVLTVHENARIPKFDNIILPVDNSVASRQKLAHAVFIASYYKSKIHVLGLLTDEDDDEHVKLFKLKIEQVNEFLEKNKISHESTIIPSTNHSNTIMRFAEERNADLIIIMTEQELDGPGIFLGVSAQRIVNHSDIPVMSVSPEGFSAGGYKNNPI